MSTADGTAVRVAGADPDRRLLEAVDGIDGMVAEVGSTGVPQVEPLVLVTREGRTAFHAGCTADRADDVADALAEGFGSVASSADAVAEHDPATSRLPDPGPELPGIGTGVRNALGACGWRRPTEPDDHEAADGFVDPEPDAVLRAGADLDGRGWGDARHDEPVADAWDAVRASGEDSTVVVNAHGNPADALLLASAPFEVLDGASTLARTVDADRVVVYASRADERAVETVRRATERYPNPGATFDVATGPADYRAAEPTMALEAIEGTDRLEARIRPPGPESVGLHGRPTLVHSARTLAHLAVRLRGGDPAGSRIVTVSGDVAAPATVELPETEPVATALDAATVEGEVKAACVGGRFGGVTGDLDVAVDPAALAEADLGTDGTVQVLADDRCVVEFVGRRTRFAAEENCGRCVPCREGATQLTGLLRDVYDGRYDREAIAELVRVMATSSICEFGVAAGRPARTAMAEFDAEFAAHADGRCPAGRCLETAEANA